MPLSPFHPLIQEWFNERFGKPTPVQTRAWPEIAAGRHVLVTAPTGTGKTLAAFLWAIDRLITEDWPGNQVRVLYVSPLKALNNDVQRNLTAPLTQLRERFEGADPPMPDIRVLTRSGDTPQTERRRMLSRPPQILITTPESLNLILTAKNARRMLSGLTTVILDEIHAMAGTKRGTHLITAVDRLVPLAGDFQRIALSATVRPASEVAAFVGGYEMAGEAREPSYRQRDVTVVAADAPKQMELAVRFPEDARERLENDSWWPALTAEFARVIDRRRATLLFANSRRLTEKVTRLVNAATPGRPIAYAHHGSLSKELRLAVEHRLKHGQLKAIVATNSLELGIDIGNLDQVVLIQTPPTVASTLQRIGRSGHRVGKTSRGAIYPTHGRDFLNAAVTARCAAEGDIEAIRPPTAPLDVLAQVVLSMTVVEQWDVDELFAFVRTSHPFHELTRRNFDRVLDMLAGRHAQTRIRELSAKVRIDRIDNTIRARAGAAMLLFMTGGTIPDRGYFNLRIDGTGEKVGELDEEFVWERRIGDTFALGTQTWRIRAVTHNDVAVTPAGGGPGIFPFWRAEARNRDFHLAEKIADFLETADALLEEADESGLEALLRARYAMAATAAGELGGFLRRQKAATRSALPHRHHLLVEHFDDPLNRADAKQVILHTQWGGRINRPFAMALSQAWENQYGWTPELFADDDAVILLLPHTFTTRDVLDRVTPDNLDDLLRQRLSQTGFFGARFRENAGRALLLPKVHFKRRMPLWLNRLRAKKLMSAVSGIRDFPLMLETWRTCLQDAFDLPNLTALLDEIADGRIAIGETRTAVASPFARGLIWQQVNRHMYEDDRPASDRSPLTEDLYREVAGSSALRPRFPEALITALEHKLQRTAPGYAPATAEALLAWTAERLVVPQPQWQTLLAAMARDHGASEEAMVAAVAPKLIRLRLPGAAIDVICALENLPRIQAAFGCEFETLRPRRVNDGQALQEFPKALERLADRMGDGEVSGLPDGPADVLGHWLAFQGPLPQGTVADVLGLSARALGRHLDTLRDQDLIIVDRFRKDADEPEICDRHNLEVLLRMARRARQPAFTALPIHQLQLFSAAWQGLTRPGGGIDDLAKRLEQLFGLGLPAGAWEEWVLPARLTDYAPAWLDSLMQSSSLVWTGCGREKVYLSFEEDRELFPVRAAGAESRAARNQPASGKPLFPDGSGRYSLLEMARRSQRSTAALTRDLWNRAWQGTAANDTFAVLRAGIANKFEPAAEPQPRRGRRRGRFDRWKGSRPMAGNWYAIDPGPVGADSIQAAELDKDRVRVLLERYGVLFRERLARELPPLQWRRLFRSLRLMELSGEILSGQFFDGIPGPQYASMAAFRMLRRPLPEAAVFWMNAADPASVCGLGIEALKPTLPSRKQPTWLVFLGADPMMVLHQNGKRLEVRAPPDHPRLPEGFGVFRTLVGRAFNPRRAVLVETINAIPALQSPYAGALRSAGFVEDHKGLELRPVV
jgi:ATP-dependent Lhr-like helicase